MILYVVYYTLGGTPMSTFIIQPHSVEAVVAITAVKESIEKRKYIHYVKPMGKTSGKGMVSFSHMDITTDYNKAIEQGFMLPDYWLREQKNGASNRFKREKEAVCSSA